MLRLKREAGERREAAVVAAAGGQGLVSGARGDWQLEEIARLEREVCSLRGTPGPHIRHSAGWRNQPSVTASVTRVAMQKP